MGSVVLEVVFGDVDVFCLFDSSTRADGLKHWTLSIFPRQELKGWFCLLVLFQILRNRGCCFFPLLKTLKINESFLEEFPVFNSAGVCIDVCSLDGLLEKCLEETVPLV